MKWKILLALAVSSAALAATKSTIGIPDSLADYRSWSELTAGPRQLPYGLAVQCLAVTDAERKKILQMHGPHANVWASVFANDTAWVALKAKADFAPGSIIVKEKTKEQFGQPDGVAFMIKHGKGEFAASGGWEFRYYPAPAAGVSYRGCVDCHRRGAVRDYVFSTPRREWTAE